MRFGEARGRWRLALGALLGALSFLSFATVALATPFFSPVGSLGYARLGAAGATLPDGRVLVIGGVLEFNEETSSVEAFSAGANAFAPAGYLNIGRAYPAAATLGDGRVLVSGGVDENEEEHQEAFQSAEIFNPATNNATPTGSMAVPREKAGAAPLLDGRVLVVGGVNKSGYLGSAEIYDPATGAFTSTGSMAVHRAEPAVAPLPDGRVLIAGGFDRNDPDESQWRRSTAEIFNPATGTFSPTGSLAEYGVSGALAAPLPDGRILIAGGYQAPHNFSSREGAEIYDPATGTFSFTSAMTIPRGNAAGGLLPDGRVLVAGGSSHLSLVGSAETFNTDPLPSSDGVDFGSRPFGVAAGPSPVVITNRGAQPLHIGSGISITGANSGDFAIVADTCTAATLTSLQSCRVDIRFTPAAIGGRSASLQLADDAAGSPQGFPVKGVGAKGPAPKVKLGKHPPKVVKTAGKKAKVSFKFSSSTQSVGFACKVDKAKKFTPCKSPKSFKAKLGPHKFQVEAVSAGVAGKPLAYSFKVVKKKAR